MRLLQSHGALERTRVLWTGCCASLLLLVSAPMHAASKGIGSYVISCTGQCRRLASVHQAALQRACLAPISLRAASAQMICMGRKLDSIFQSGCGPRDSPLLVDMRL